MCLYLCSLSLLFIPSIYYAVDADYLNRHSGLCDSPHHDDVIRFCDLVLGSAIPFTFILTGNTIIIIALVKQTYCGSSRSSHVQANSMPIVHLTATLIVVSVAFVLFTLPQKVYPLVVGEEEHSSGYMRALAVALALGKLNYLNNAANFYLYCVTGRRFRQKSVSFFRRCCHRNG